MINPYKIWLMVVLIAGLNFVGYMLVKVLGSEHGIGLTGVLGGLVSSTAVTLSFSQRSRQGAGAIAGLRARDRAGVDDHVRARRGDDRARVPPTRGLPLGDRARHDDGRRHWRCLSCSGGAADRARPATVTTGANPFELGEAISSGCYSAVVTVAAKAAEVYLGEAGLYLAGAVAGLTDVDAIALSMANLAASKPREHDGGGAHDRDRGAREHGGEDGHGGVDGRTRAAPHDAISPRVCCWSAAVGGIAIASQWGPPT